MADDYPDNWTTPGVLPTGGTVTGNIEKAYDADWFLLDLEMLHGYLFTVATNNGTKPEISVFDKWGQIPLYTTAEGSFNYVSLDRPYTPTQSQQYYLQVRGASPGTYTVGVREAPDDYANGFAAARPLTTTAPMADAWTMPSTRTCSASTPCAARATPLP